MIALLTFVLPPLAAHQVHVRRIERAREAVVRLATALKAEGGGVLTEVAGQGGREPFVLVGQGAAPAFTPSLGWPTDRMRSLNAVVQGLSNRPTPGVGVAIDDPPDPWGNQYLVVVGGPGSSKTVVVISAGPNGTVETPFGSASSPKGDDIVAVR